MEQKLSCAQSVIKRKKVVSPKQESICTTFRRVRVLNYLISFPPRDILEPASPI